MSHGIAEPFDQWYPLAIVQPFRNNTNSIGRYRYMNCYNTHLEQVLGSLSYKEMEGILVDPAVFKAVVGRAERPGCVRFARISAIEARNKDKRGP